MTEYIHNIDELLKISRKGTYEIVNDIDCEGKSISKIIGDFSGVIDGAGHIIKNLILHDEIWGDEQTLALFYSMNRAEIKNINFDNICMDYTRGVYNPRIGALAGVCADCIFDNIVFSVSNSSNDDTTLVYEASNCKMQNIKIVCNGKENPVAKYN